MKAATLGSRGSVLLPDSSFGKIGERRAFIQPSLQPPGEAVTWAIKTSTFLGCPRLEAELCWRQRQSWRTWETPVLPVAGAGSLSLPFFELPTVAVAEVGAGLRAYDKGHQECLLPTPNMNGLYQVQPTVSRNQRLLIVRPSIYLCTTKKGNVPLRKKNMLSSRQCWPLNVRHT